MENILLHSGLPALFILSFLAATILPLGSEWLLIALLLNDYDVTNVVAIASIGNFLGACTTYAIGFWGSDFLLHKLLRIDTTQTTKAMTIFRKYGSWSLLFSWVPILGDPLCLVAGSLRLHFATFTTLTFIGKSGRYALIAAITNSSKSLG